MSRFFKFSLVFLNLFIVSCASVPYQMPLLKKTVQQFPERFDLNKPVNFEVMLTYEKKEEITDSERLLLRKNELKNSILSSYGLIYRLPIFDWRAEIIQTGICNQNQDEVNKEISEFCKLTNEDKSNRQDFKLHSVQEVKRRNLDQLIFQSRGVINHIGGGNVPFLTYVSRNCVNSSNSCSLFAAKNLKNTSSWREDDLFRHHGDGLRAQQIVWRSSEFVEDTEDSFNGGGVIVNYATLTPTIGNSYKGTNFATAYPIVTNLDLANYFSENVPILEFNKFKNIKQRIFELFSKYEISNFGKSLLTQLLPKYICSNDESTKYDSEGKYRCGMNQVHNFPDPKLGINESNMDRERLWSVLLVAFSTVEVERRGENVLLKFTIDLPSLLKEIKIKPRKYLLTPEYQKQFEESFVENVDESSR